MHELGKMYARKGMPVEDSIRGGSRVEMPALFSLGLEGSDKAKALRIVREMQREDGSFLEYPYQAEDEKVGYWGAVPTAFSAVALAKGSYLEEAVRSADFLLSKENAGKFHKSKVNSTDALNTNLLSAVALMEVMNLLPKKSRRRPIYAGACGRAMLRTIKAQTIKGAFPYAGNGFGVSLIYHAMTLSLLLHLQSSFGSRYAAWAIWRGLGFLNRSFDADRGFRWEKDTVGDKLGAQWGYAWASHPMVVLTRNEDALDILRKTIDREDLFYTAWCMLPLKMAEEDRNLKIGIGQYLWLPFRLRKYFSQLRRKLVLFDRGIDLGPIEYW